MMSKILGTYKQDKKESFILFIARGEEQRVIIPPKINNELAGGKLRTNRLLLKFEDVEIQVRIPTNLKYQSYKLYTEVDGGDSFTIEIVQHHKELFLNEDGGAGMTPSYFNASLNGINPTVVVEEITNITFAEDDITIESNKEDSVIEDLGISNIPKTEVQTSKDNNNFIEDDIEQSIIDDYQALDNPSTLYESKDKNLGIKAPSSNATYNKKVVGIGLGIVCILILVFGYMNNGSSDDYDQPNFERSEIEDMTSTVKPAKKVSPPPNKEISAKPKEPEKSVSPNIEQPINNVSSKKDRLSEIIEFSNDTSFDVKKINEFLGFLGDEDEDKKITGMDIENQSEITISTLKTRLENMRDIGLELNRKKDSMNEEHLKTLSRYHSYFRLSNKQNRFLNKELRAFYKENEYE